MDPSSAANAAKRPFDLVSSSGNSPASANDYSTAATSAVPTPGSATPEEQAEAQLHLASKKLKLKFGSSGTGATTGDRAELDRRRDAFLRAHAKVYLAVLPEKNHVANLLKGYEGRVLNEVVPYHKLEQPKTIQGGTMKDYQLSGLSFLAYMFENGQNCILADE